MSGRWWLLLLGVLGSGCGEQDVDLEDELKGKEDYELVLLSEPKQAERKMATADSTAALAQAPDSSAAAAAPEDQAAPAEPPIRYDPDGEFTVQIGTFDDARLAGERVRALSAEGYPAYALSNIGNKGARVRIGYFRTRDEAARFGRVFKQDKGAEFWVDRRANEKL